MIENDTLIPISKKTGKTSKKANPFRIIPNPAHKGRWIVEMSHHHNGETNRIFCGDFKSPEEAQKVWDMDEPTNSAELIAQGFAIQTKGLPAPKRTPKAIKKAAKAA